MDKLHRSSRSPSGIAALVLLVAATNALAISISREDARVIGRKVWQNECGGTVSGLTSWNEGEDFASLGIGHFIWYPAGKRGPFDESFPKLLAFFSQHHVDLPPWLVEARACPWNSRAEFMQARDSSTMIQLRALLANTIDLQTQFLVERLQNSLAKMVAETSMPQHVKDMFERVALERNGTYALIDYVNFKGEGTLATERYKGKGWGLLQVLEQMRPGVDQAGLTEFANAAKLVLKRRVENSPPERHESKWLPGWLNRVNGYTRG